MVVHKMRCCSVASNLNDFYMHLLSEGQIKCFCFRLETQRLPVTAASTLLLLLKLHLMQIFTHCEVDMWGRV